MIVHRLTLAAALLTATPAAVAQSAGAIAPGAGGDEVRLDERWADSVLATLSLRAKVGQLFMRWISGRHGGAESKEMATAAQWLREDSLGGFIISIGTPAELAAKTNALQRLSRVPLIFGADLEFGPGQRLIPAGAMFPPPMGITATGDTSASCDHGRVTAREARAVGIHWVFAPDVDLNVSPENPIINTRAYGETAADVSRFAVPFLRCAQRHGVLTTAKHFVGHGASGGIDSHRERPVLALDRAELDTTHLAPFRAAIDAGVAAIMSAHIALPGVAGDSQPISLGRRMLTELLRREWGFDRLLITDALWMGGATQDGRTPGELAVLAIEAGNDVILDPRDHRPMIEGILAAVRQGRLSEARIDSSVRRLLIAKASVGLDAGRYVDPARVPAIVGTAETDSLSRAIAQRSIVLLRDDRGLLPLHRALARSGDSVLVVAYLDEGAQPASGIQPGVAFGRTLSERLAPHGAAVTLVKVLSSATAAELRDIATRASRQRLLILAPYVRPLASKGSIGLPPRVDSSFRQMAAAHERAIVVAFGDPYLIRGFATSATALLAWNPWSGASERAAALALTGAAPITGRLPVTLAPHLPRGHGVQTNLAALAPASFRVDAAVAAALRDTLQGVLAQAVRDSAFPGAIALVGNREGIIARATAGRIDWRDSPPPDERTIWDMASLTKVVGMTTAMMQLVERGQVELDAPVQRYLPEWTGGGKEHVTIRQLLTHSAGLPAWRPLYKEAFDSTGALALALATPLDTLPGVRYVYSDIGAIVAGAIVRRLTGEPLDRYLAREVFAPLGMHDTRFRPPASLRDRIAPTEYDPWRQRHLRGEVHDENAFALGGVSGHAGLFSTAHDLARFARMYLNRGELDGVRVLKPETIARFTALQAPWLSHRALGWETPTGSNSAGRLLSPTAFGHTGFTGTSLWIDPANGLFVVLLSNRVNPTRENRRIGAVRVALADAVMKIAAPLAAGRSGS